MQASKSLQTLQISKIRIGKRFRKVAGDIDGLVESIRNVGLLHPLVVTEDNRLVAGYRRLQACKKLGKKEVPVNYVNLKNIIEGEFAENCVRKDFTISEVIAIKRQIEKTKHSGRPRKSKNVSKFDTFPRGSSLDLAAKATGYSRQTIHKAEKVVQAAEQEPRKYNHIVEQLDNGRISVDAAYKAVTQQEQVNSERFKVEHCIDLCKHDFPDGTKVSSKQPHVECTNCGEFVLPYIYADSVGGASFACGCCRKIGRVKLPSSIAKKWMVQVSQSRDVEVIA